ncbi:choice-of-anchor P family protein [Herbidospora cretacea]|uniref:choice-of-anchor P family protein n=1 Tax=Herbidospora cretacea TaxID=28444 RepID=UPI000ADE4EC9|nr:choice-of-anchor P family protein [Herbidospora cretacea]
MFLGRTFAVSLAALTTLLAGTTSTAHASSETLNAYGASITLPLGLRFRPAPEAEPGNPTAQIASINIGTVSTGAVAVEVEQNTAVGTESARASVDGLNAALLGVGLTAGSVRAECTAVAGQPATGSTTLADAQVLGTPLNSSPAPGTTLRFPLVEVRLNEQIPNSDGSLTVHGMRVRALSGDGDVILSSATCGPATLDAPSDAPLASGAGLYLALGLAAAGGGTMLLRRRRRFG